MSRQKHTLSVSQKTMVFHGSKSNGRADEKQKKKQLTWFKCSLIGYIAFRTPEMGGAFRWAQGRGKTTRTYKFDGFSTQKAAFGRGLFELLWC